MSIAPIPVSLQATIADFSLAFGEFEAKEISELDQPYNQVVNSPRLQMFLDSAFAIITSADILACIAGKVYLRQNCRRLQLDIAHYFADSLSPRPQIKQRYDDAIVSINSAKGEDYCQQEIAIPPGLGLLSTDPLLDASAPAEPSQPLSGSFGEQRLTPLGEQNRRGILWL